jgi:hypothetical protein
VTVRSSNSDTTDKLEIGRYDRTSALPRQSFLNVGMMNASLNKWPAANERLKSVVRNGASSLASSFKIGTGSRSADELLLGSPLNAEMLLVGTLQLSFQN